MNHSIASPEEMLNDEKEFRPMDRKRSYDLILQGNPSDILQEIHVPIVESDVCKDFFLSEGYQVIF